MEGDEVLHFEQNQKGNETVLCGGYRYTVNARNKNNTTNWRCIKRTECSASVTIHNERKKIIRKSTHTCIAQPKANEVFIAKNNCKKEVCEDLGPIQHIYEKHFETLKNKGSKYLDYIPEFKQFKDNLYRTRKAFFKTNTLNFARLEDVHIPEVLAKKFLVCDDGGSDKILIFCTKIVRRVIRANPAGRYLGDGTFKCAPKPFYQIFSLHLDLGSNENTTNICPMIYGLLPNKTEETYVRFFQLVKDILGLKMGSFKCDYENAIINAVFPDVSINACFFHFQKAVKKKAKDLKLYDSREGRNITRMTACLPLLPGNYIRSCWESILEDASQTRELKAFTTYFEGQWLKKFSPDLLSCSENMHRTTNALEGWHHRLGVKFPKKPQVCHFVQKLIKECKHYNYIIRNSYFYSAKKNRRNSDIAFNKKLRKYTELLKQDKITPKQFIKKTIFARLIKS